MSGDNDEQVRVYDPRIGNAALATLLLCSPLEEAKAYRIAGIGLRSCGSWTATRGQGAAAIGAEQWVLGFLSGVAFCAESEGSSVDPLDGTDANGVWAWIDNYCRKNPLDQLEEAPHWFVLAQPRSRHPAAR
jgi:hypothetical protein